MPAQRLDQIGVSLECYDLVGSDSDTVEGFVRHMGLADPGARGVPRGEEVTVAHMGPPLETDGAMTASIVGSVGLSVEETNQIKVFIDEHRTEHLASLRLEPAGKYKTYLIRPHVQPESAMDGTVKFVRFSCVGFAIEAYRDAGIDVVVTDEALLPDVQLETLLNAYPGATVESWEWLNNRYKWGCNGDGPWRVVLPGYVFHALSKIARGSRSFQAYIPQAGDERFL